MASKRPSTRPPQRRTPASRAQPRSSPSSRAKGAAKKGAGKKNPSGRDARSSAGVRQKTRRRGPARAVAHAGPLVVTELAELEQLRRELDRATRQAPLRWNADPDDVQRSVAQLVLTLVEFVRKLLERQAIRRMEAGTLTEEQTEDVGRALMQLEQTVRDIAARFGIDIDDLNLDLGPVGKLM